MSDFDAIYQDIWRRLQNGESPGISDHSDELVDLFGKGKINGPDDVKAIVEGGGLPDEEPDANDAPGGLSEEDRHLLNMKMSEVGDDTEKMRRWKALQEQSQQGAAEPAGREPSKPTPPDPPEKPTKPSPEGKAKQYVGLDDSDRRLLMLRMSDVLDDPKVFARWASLKQGRHPDTHEPVNVRRERKAAMDANAADVMRGVKSREAGEKVTPPPRETTRGESAMDVIQTAGDVGGVIDQTGITDAINSVLSLARAYKDPKRRSEHLQNAAISAAGVIPVIGDLPKLAKLGRTKRNMQSAAAVAKKREAARNTAASVLGGVTGRKTSGGEQPPPGGASPGSKDRVEKTEARSVTRTIIDALTGRDGVRDSRDQEGRSSGGASGGSNQPPPGGPPNNQPPGDEPDGDKGVRRSKEASKAFSENLVDMTLTVGKATAALIAMFEGIRLVNKGNLLLNQHLSQVNASMARDNALREIAGIRRQFREGRIVEGAYGRATEADIAIEDVRSRFVAPTKSIFMDISAAGTKLAASLAESADKATHASKAFETGAWAIGKASGAMSESADWWSDQFAEFMKGFSPSLGRADKVQKYFDDLRKSEDGAPWYKLLNDLADGKFDGKSDAGTFFGINRSKK